MAHEEWHERWSEDRIGFHKKEISQYLPAFFPLLELKAGDCVFVPLCGKSLDMLWLADRGYRVIGIEISPIAVAAFFTDNGLTYQQESRGPFQICRNTDTELLCGDFFDLRPGDLAGVAATYDRASLVALPHEARARYAEHLVEVVPERTPVLLVTLEYTQHEMKGPPYSVHEDEVHALFARRFEITPLSSVEILDEEPHFRKKGLTSLTEKVFLLTRARSAARRSGTPRP